MSICRKFKPICYILFAICFTLKCDYLQVCHKVENKTGMYLALFNVDPKLVSRPFSLDAGQSYINRLVCRHLEHVSPDIGSKIIVNREYTGESVDRYGFLSLMDILFYKGMVPENEYKIIKKIDLYFELEKVTLGFVDAVTLSSGNIKFLNSWVNQKYPLSKQAPSHSDLFMRLHPAEAEKEKKIVKHPILKVVSKIEAINKNYRLGIDNTLFQACYTDLDFNPLVKKINELEDTYDNARLKKEQYFQKYKNTFQITHLPTEQYLHTEFILLFALAGERVGGEGPGAPETFAGGVGAGAGEKGEGMDIDEEDWEREGDRASPAAGYASAAPASSPSFTQTPPALMPTVLTIPQWRLNFARIPRGISFLSGLDMCPVCEHLWCYAASHMEQTTLISDATGPSPSPSPSPISHGTTDTIATARTGLPPHKVLVGGLYPFTPDKDKPTETTRTPPLFSRAVTTPELLELFF